MSSVFKGLGRSDVYTTDYTSRKEWRVSGSNLAELGVKLIRAVSSSRPYYPIEEDYLPYSSVSGTVGATSSYTDGYYNKHLAFGGIYETYYNGSLRDGTFSGSTELYLQTNLTITGSRTLPERNWGDAELLPDHQWSNEPVGFTVVSVPGELFGICIIPGSIRLEPDKDIWCYVEDDYISHETGSFCDEGYPEGVWSRSNELWVDPYFEDLHMATVHDFEGVLLGDGFQGEWHWPDNYRYPTPKLMKNSYLGDVIYTHGNIIFTNDFYRRVLADWDFELLEWESSKPIFTKHVTCKVRDIDFNRTYNPTATEELQNTPGFTPYISEVGLYNTRGDLLAVAKLSQPIKKPVDTDMTIDLQIDLG